MRYLGGPRTPTQNDEMLERIVGHWPQHGFGLWAVRLRSEGPEAPVIGFVGLSVPAFMPAVLPAVEVGWRLERRCWNSGVATEGARAALAAGFEQLGLERVVCIVHPDNAASLRVATKLGLAPWRDERHPETGQKVRVLACSRPQ